MENLYISPLEACNLHCRYCYTTKNLPAGLPAAVGRQAKTILTNQQILDFIQKYSDFIHKSYFIKPACRQAGLKSVIFCGGEVFTLRNFPRLINQLHQKNIFTTIITNGTIDHLKAITDPTNCQLLVSFDGPREIHDYNRGTGNFDKSVKFVTHALRLGFPVEIFFLITQDSYPHKDSFNLFNLPKTYLVDRLGSLTADQVKHIRQNYPVFPPKNFGCSMLSLQSDGKFYGCCESAKPIGSLSDPISKILLNYLSAYLKSPLCSDPKYFCNLKP